MRCLVLAAGYATRMYPLTENFPKPLLPVGGKPILDWLLDDVEATGMIDGCAVVTNHRYQPHFQAWRETRLNPVAILDDGSQSNAERLGAVRDIQFAIDSLGLDDDLLVIAGDNLLDFSLESFIRYAGEVGTTCVMRYVEPSLERRRRSGVLRLDEAGRVLEMQEKPPEPISEWCAPPIYFYARRDLPMVRRGIEAGCGVDAPGSFIAWLCGQVPVHAWKMIGRRYDIGSLDTYEEAKRAYRGITVRAGD